MAKLRTLLGMAAAVAVTGAARPLVQRWRAMQGVAPDLRTPMLLLPVAPGSPRHLKLVRRAMDRAPGFPVADGIRTESVTAEVDGREPVRVLVFERPDRDRPSGALLWIHGGGTVIGRPEQSSAICSRWADELGILVAAVDYRLAPEHPYPAPLDDCDTALRWLHAHAESVGVDPARIAVGGDSAGGLLAASLAQRARDHGGPPICFQLLEYPMLDDRTVLQPDPGLERSFVWSPKASRFGWTSYLAAPPPAATHLHAAVPARTEDLQALPPAWIGVGDIDLLHDEGVEYARRLRAAGVDSELHVEPAMYHGADSIRPGAETSNRFVDQMTAALARALS